MSVVGILAALAIGLAVALVIPTRFPRPERVAALLRSGQSQSDRRQSTPRWSSKSESPRQVIRQLLGLPEVLGGWLRGRLGRSPAPEVDRRLGLTVVGGGLGLAVHPVVTLGVVGLVWSLPVLRKRRELRQRRDQIREQLPDLVDMLRIAVGAGMTVRLAIDAVAARSDGVIGEHLREVQRRVQLGQRLHEALDALAEMGDPVIPLTAALTASEHDGSPLVPSLERVAAETRLMRRHAAEEAARRLPVKLLFPLVACILPAFVLLTVVPLLGGAIGSLGL